MISLCPKPCKLINNFKDIMPLNEHIQNKKTQILNLWLQRLCDAYPEEGGRFFRQKKSEFSNPVGHNFRVGLENILDELMQDKASEALTQYVDDIVRIRAVQGIPPSEAACFPLELMPIIRQVLKKELKEPQAREELFNFQEKLNDLTSLSLDLYVQCREYLWSKKASFMRDHTRKLLEKADLIKEVPDNL
ncbi:MAG: RsbRD N-terminal domain-containing protein [Desulfonatronovibrionaceae bacterium]